MGTAAEREPPRPLRNHDRPGKLRVVLEERLLVAEVFARRLHVAVLIRRAGDDRVLAWSCALPLIGEDLPSVFALSGFHRRFLPRSVVDFDLDRANRRAVVQYAEILS